MLFRSLGADPDELSDPASGFHAVMADDDLVGFRSFGPDGRVPGWTYDDGALDTGGGLRPDLTGLGAGRGVIAAGLAYGLALHRPSAFRMTVAAFNVRALRTIGALGFDRVGEFAAERDGRAFHVLVRREVQAA